MFNVDEKYYQEFNGKVGQLFCYITSKCNTDCVQCLYKPLRSYSLLRDEINKEDMFNLLAAYRKMGALKTTFMGGEPTLHKDLPEIIRKSKELGYKYVRIDTNGLFDKSLLLNPDFKMLDEITFSLDDYDPQINDAIRGKNYFKKCVATINHAHELGYKMHLTCCIHNQLTKRDENGKLRLDSMIDFAESLHFETINFHTLFKANIPRDSWTGNIHTSINDYLELISEYFSNNEALSQRKIKIRLPQGFTTKEEFSEEPEYFGYCCAKQRDRALLFPDGTIKVCSLMIGSTYYVAYYDKDGIHYNDTPTNELLSHADGSSTPCTHQLKKNMYSPYLPLCVSFKPKQNELVWLEKLNWENKRKAK